MNPILDSEYSNIISTLPNNKASGPSSITYKAVQHAGPLCHSFIIRLLNACIHTTLIPNHWQHALLFPIPKPTDWECSIDKTRPIILLEIFRKVLSKILTLRLSTVFTQHCILQGGNFTELPGGSTFEPIHMINLIREDAIRNNKEVWFLFQDLSKAYDRVNIHLLRKCMLRLKIPSTFINLILSFFTRRTNAIITSSSITTLYDIKVGIDQGKVISPLL